MTRFVLLCAGLLFWTAAPAGADWSDNFDSYALGTQLFGVGGWSGWDGVSTVVGEVSADFSRSSPHSIKINDGADDAIHQFSGYTSGQWLFIGYQYVPTGLTSVTYFIINNVYADGGPYDWAIETHMDPATGLVWDQIRDSGMSMAAPLVKDKWIEVRTEIDLDANFMQHFYNGQMISSGVWNAYLGLDVAIANLDLYGPHSQPVYWDDLVLMGPEIFEPGDLNCDKQIDAFDIDPFVLALTDPDGYKEAWPDCDITLADINDDGSIDAFDIDPFVELLIGP